MGFEVRSKTYLEFSTYGVRELVYLCYPHPVVSNRMWKNYKALGDNGTLSREPHILNRIERIRLYLYFVFCSRSGNKQWHRQGQHHKGR